MRVFAMLLIFVWHVMGHYLPFVQTKPTTLNVILNYFCLFITFHVDLFVLITGYFGVKNPINGTVKTLSLCIYYAIFLNLLSYITQGYFSIEEVLLPISHTQWWFMRVYIILILIAPIIESYIIKSQKHLCYLLALSFFVNIILGFLWHSENFYGHGYDISNFIFMYLIGAWLRSDGIFVRHFKKNIPLILTSIVLCCFVRYKVQPLNFVKWTDYSSPLNILMAVFIFCLFLRIRISSCWNRLIMFFSTSAISVYLITDHEAFRHAIMPCFSNLIINNNDNVALQILYVIIFIISIFIICCIFDKIRISATTPLNKYIISRIKKL